MYRLYVLSLSGQVYLTHQWGPPTLRERLFIAKKWYNFRFCSCKLARLMPSKELSLTLTWLTSPQIT